jgi:hypothetical protein
MSVMKHTKLAGIVGLCFIFSCKSALALVPNIRVVTPTKIILIENVRQVSTNTPTPTTNLLPNNVRKIVTMAPKVTETIPPTLVPSEIPTPTEFVATPTNDPTAVTTVAVSKEISDNSTKSQDNLTFWFLVVTIGLLAVIILIQAWPKKDEGEEKEE